MNGIILILWHFNEYVECNKIIYQLFYTTKLNPYQAKVACLP